MNCKNCGANLEVNDVFCKNCGAQVTQPIINNEGGEQNQITYQNQPNMNSQQVNYAEQSFEQQYNDNSKKKMDKDTKVALKIAIIISCIPVLAIIIGLIIYIASVANQVVENAMLEEQEVTSQENYQSTEKINKIGNTNSTNSTNNTENINSAERTSTIICGNFSFLVPDNLIYEYTQTAVGVDAIEITDLDGTWDSVFSIMQDDSFELIKADKEEVEEYLEEQYSSIRRNCISCKNRNN